MAWYYGTFSCGHEGRVNVIGPQRDRQWKIDRKFGGLCEDCYKKHLEKEKERKNKEAEEKAKEMELPELTGTEKQIAWANTLRQSFIDKINRFIEENKDDEDDWEYRTDEYKELKGKSVEDIKVIMDYVLINKTEARYYINNREYKSLYLLASVAREALKSDDDKINEKLVNEIKLESAIFPENAVTNNIVEIIIGNSKISVKFEKNETFRTVVKSLNYKWNGIWEREITETNGPIENRAAELGNKLLNNGFPICILDEKIKEKAINADYENECTKWIYRRKDTDKFAINWYGYNDDLYSKARKLPGAKWDNSSILVDVSHYKEVEEFAELLGFKFTQKAIQLKEEYLEKLSKAEIVSPNDWIEEVEKDGLEDILNSSREILDDLKEDD